MSIRSLFTSHEELLAHWMMHLPFNDQIHAELRFPKEDSTKVQNAYFTPPEELGPPVELTEHQRKEVATKRLIRFADAPAEPLNEVVEGPMRNKVKRLSKKTPFYQIVHREIVEKVEKLIFPKHAKYGNFWGRSHYKISDKSTDFYLIEGWLVVFIPEKKEEKKFEMEHGEEISVIHKFEGAEDPIGTRLSLYLQSWFAFHKEKLWIVFATCLSSTMVLSLTALALANSHNFYSTLFSRALLIGAIAMKTMVLYTGIKLYKLHHLEYTTLGRIHNLGDWVQQVRMSAGAYPTLSADARIGRFFTQKELLSIMGLMRKDTTITGYIRRFFDRNSCLRNSKPT
jgi:hypothetical protein